MPLAEEIVTSRYRINAYSDDSITVNEAVYRNSLVLSAEDMLTPWPVTTVDQLEVSHLEIISRLNPEVVLLGTGVRQQFPSARIFAHFGQQGIGLEVMDNGALCRTFNILVAEDRAVVAAVLINPAEGKD